MKKIFLSFVSLVVIGANSLFAYNMLWWKPNIIAIASEQYQNGNAWETTDTKTITTFNHGGDTRTVVDVYEVPLVKPYYIWIGSHMGHYDYSTNIQYNGYIVGYRHYYDFYNVSTGTNNESMEIQVNPNKVEYTGSNSDYLTIR